MEFGEQLKLLREAKRLTQAELAERVNLSRAAISLYEAGTREPRHSEVRRIAEALDVPRGFFDQDDLWAEVEEALAQAKELLLSGKKSARDSQFISASDSQLGAAHVAESRPSGADDFCSQATSPRPRVAALSR